MGYVLAASGCLIQQEPILPRGWKTVIEDWIHRELLWSKNASRCLT